MSGRAPRTTSAVPPLRRWKCVCAYDGTTFAGWQSQAGGTAIQDVIEARLAQIFKGPVRIHGSGRTDAGVHAHGQVFHFDAAWAHGAGKLLLALRVLPWQAPRTVLGPVLLLTIPLYLLLALRRVYGEAWKWTVPKALAAAMLYLIALGIGLAGVAGLALYFA